MVDATESDTEQDILESELPKSGSEGGSGTISIVGGGNSDDLDVMTAEPAPSPAAPQNPSAAQSRNPNPSRPPSNNSTGQNQETATTEPSGAQQAAVDMANAGNFKAAQDIIAQGLKDNPNDPQLVLMDKLLKENRPPSLRENKALEAGMKALTNFRAPEIQEASFVAGMGQSRAASAPRQVEGREYFKKDLSKKAMEQLQIKDYKASERSLTLAIGRHPDNGFAFRLRGLVRHYMNKFETGYQDAERAVQLNPLDGGSHNIKALLLTDLGKNREALEEASAALALSSNKAERASALVTRAKAREGLGQWDERLADLKAAAEADPGFTNLYKQALQEKSSAPAMPGLRSRLWMWWTIVGTAFILLSILLLAHRGNPTVKRILRLSAQESGLHGFQIIREVGQGGMGVVFEALDEGLQRRVAIKRMRPEIADDERERRRFLKEARTVASLRHPNIVEIHSVLEQPDGLFLVFEYVDGDSLAKILSAKPRLSLSQAAETIRQVGLALDFAHEKGIVHQDLKPSNVMVAGGIAKVMDFGIARRVLETLSTMSRCEVMGTPGYMAPEQQQGEYVAESDIYALGVCLYEMLSGARPFGVASYLEKMNADFRALSSFVKDLPAGIDQIVAKALAPAPANRYKTAKAFVTDLDGILR